jgi:cytochrome c2
VTSWLAWVLLPLVPYDWRLLELVDRAPAGDGQAVAARFQCQRCHAGTGLEDPPLAQQCVGCHEQILAGTFEAPRASVRRWQGNLKNLRAVPSLNAIGGRFRRAWIAGFLREPHDLRPGIPSLMPRLPLTAEDSEALAAWLVPTEAAGELGPGDPESGRRLLDTRGCGTCHRMSGVVPLAASPIPVPISGEKRARGMALAPDLIHTRVRFQPGALVRWLRDPAAVKPDTEMPGIGLSPEEASDIAAYLWQTPVSTPPPAEPPSPLPALTRRVGFEEVNQKVFSRTCWHCHAQPDFARGDGGPGNTGGFGFPPRRLDLSSYEGVSSGAHDDQGKRRSIFRPLEDGTPLLVAVLRARHEEQAGRPRDGLRGMPLGLEPLSARDIQLVESWVGQGRPE